MLLCGQCKIVQIKERGICGKPGSDYVRINFIYLILFLQRKLKEEYNVTVINNKNVITVTFSDGNEDVLFIAEQKNNKRG